MECFKSALYQITITISCRNSSAVHSHSLKYQWLSVKTPGISWNILLCGGKNPFWSGNYTLRNYSLNRYFLKPNYTLWLQTGSKKFHYQYDSNTWYSRVYFSWVFKIIFLSFTSILYSVLWGITLCLCISQIFFVDVQWLMRTIIN